MGRWTPLILMAGGLAILLGTLLGINFPIGGQQSASNNAPGGRASRVLPANINVNSSAPSRSTNNGTTPAERSSVAQDSFTTPNDRSSVAQSNTSNDSFSSPETRSSTRSTNVQSSTSSSSAANRSNEPIRALW